MSLTPEQLEKIAKTLEAYPEYRVLRKMPPLDLQRKAAGPTAKLLILDTETTGLNHQDDEVIDIGLICIEAEVATGRFIRVIDQYQGLQDPGFPIPEHITALTKITQDMVIGQKIDISRVESIISQSDLVIAHNAGFDRRFAEKLTPAFVDINWACSFAEIPWNVNGFGSSKLEFIANQVGFFYDGHRALVDCVALAHVLDKAMCGNESAMLHLIDASRRSQYKLLATGAPFEAKDALRENNYRWDGDAKVWGKILKDDVELNAELDWLKDHIYNRPARVQIEYKHAGLKFSDRPGKIEWMSIGSQGDTRSASATRSSVAGKKTRSY